MKPPRAIACMVVLTLPLCLAGITTSRAIESRANVTAHSRSSTSTVIVHHSHQKSSMIERPMKAMPVIALSAIGSAILPKFGDQVVLAGEVAVDLVGDHRDREEQRTPPTARSAESPPSCSSAHAKNGTITMRRVVSALGTFQLLTWSLGLAHRRSSGGCRLATRSTPSEPITVAVTRSPTRAPAGRPVQRRGAVDLGALVRGAALGARRPRRDSTSTIDLLADALLGPLGGELLDQAR